MTNKPSVNGIVMSANDGIPEEMSKELIIGDIQVNVDKEKAAELRKLLKDKGVDVYDTGEFEYMVTHVPYDFDTFISKARDYSDKNPPDIVQFSEKAWGAASICVIMFYLKNFKTLITSHGAKRAMTKAVCAGLGGKESQFVWETWRMAEELHSNFYKNEFIEKEDREERLESISKMAEIINGANVTNVRTKFESLQNLGSVRVKPASGSCEIGKDKYNYEYTAV